MVADVQQTVSGFTAEFEIIGQQGLIGTARFPNNFLVGGPCICLYRTEEYLLQYHPNSLSHNLFRSARHRRIVPYSIEYCGQSYGELFGRISDGNIFSRYEYDCLSLGSTEYEMFEVGLGNSGIVYPIYRNGRLTAELDKDVTVYHHLDHYRLYAEDESALKNAVLLCLYLDARSFANRGQIAVSSVEKTFYLTTNKNLREKYDPNFKHRISRQ